MTSGMFAESDWFCSQAISAMDVPFSNCFLYDGVLGSGIVEQLGV